MVHKSGFPQPFSLHINVIHGPKTCTQLQKLCCLLEKDEAVERVYFFANRETEYELAYRARYGMWPLEDIIVFRSGPHAGGYVKGMDFSDNARALFEYMLSAGLNGKYKLVWVVRNPEEFQSYEKYH